MNYLKPKVRFGERFLDFWLFESQLFTGKRYAGTWYAFNFFSFFFSLFKVDITNIVILLIYNIIIKIDLFDVISSWRYHQKKINNNNKKSFNIYSDTLK